MQILSQPNGQSLVFLMAHRGRRRIHFSRQPQGHRWVQLAALLLSSILVTQSEESTSSNTTGQALSSPKFVRVEPGTFIPRKTRSEERHAKGAAAHQVEISRPFLMSRTEVSNSQMVSMLKLGLELKYVETNRGRVSIPAKRGETTITVLNYQNSDIGFANGQFLITPGKEAHPCTGVTWYGAQVYANLYSKSQNLKPAIDVHTWECDFMGAGFRLPTESEWEYAHQAGEKAPSLPHLSKSPTLSTGQSDGSHPVDTKPKNPWGLVGMEGNVSEWCWDWFGASRHSAKVDPLGPSEGWRKAVRGKHFLRSTDPSHLAVRISGLPFNENKFWGFRIVRTLVEQE